MMLQFVIFGYAVYRIVDVPAADGIVESQTSVELEVGDGNNITMRWDNDACKWTAEYVEEEDKGGWVLLILNEPIRVGTTAVELDSSAARAYADSCTCAMLGENQKRRDYLNTQLVTWTQYAKAMYASTGQRDGIDAAPSGGIGGVYGKAHFEEWLAATSAKIKGMEDLTKETRDTAMKQYRDPGSITARPEKKRRVDHIELPVGVGRDAEEVSFRRAPEDLPEFEKRLRHSIMKSYNVAPQATGENVNAERVAGSDRLSQMAIAQYMDYIKHVRSKLQLAVTDVSKRMTGTDMQVDIKPLMGSYNLKLITPILTNEAALRLYATVYETPEEDISVRRLATYIDGMSENPAGDKRSANAHDGDGTGQTQAEVKQDNRDKKNMT